MSNYVRFRFSDEGDGTGELEAAFAADGFAGVGRAYFDVARLVDQVNELTAFPLPSPKGVEIQGGYWESTGGTETLTQEHIGLTVRPVGATGGLTLSLRVAIPGKDPKEPPRYSASAQLATSYEAVTRFAAEMTALLKGEVSEVVLEADRG